MSGPVTSDDASDREVPPDGSAPPTVDLAPSHEATVGAMPVRRALPRRPRRTVGAWCFADHMGPAALTEDRGVDIGPHPHIGLHTVTWLVAGEILHRDSLGSAQVIRPGQLNLMRAGWGVSHSEEATGSYRGDLHGVQLWLAQPDRERHGEPRFEHHAELPEVGLDNGTATVIVGGLAASRSPATIDSDSLGVQFDLRAGRSAFALDPAHEHATIVLNGRIRVDGSAIGPGVLGYLGDGRDEVAVDVEEPAIVLLIGGVPLDEPLVMWWNFVARTRDEIAAAYQDWNDHDPRFGSVDSPLNRISADPPVWLRGR